MGIKDFAVYIALPLMVSVVAGIVVWFLTVGPSELREEVLSYSVEDIATIGSDEQSLGVVSIIMSNTGSAAAANGLAVISFPENIEIIERQISSSSGVVSNYSIDSDSVNRFTVEMPSLAAGESVTTTFLVRGEDFVPRVGFRSDASIATATYQGDVRSEPQSSLRFIAIFIPLLLTATASTAGAVLYGRYRSTSIETTESSRKNNTAFLLLHRMLPMEAAKLLDRSMEETGSSAIELANLALLDAMRSDWDRSDNLFEAALWWSYGKQVKHAILFNRSASEYLKGNVPEAEKLLGEAVALSKKSTLDYLQISLLMKSMSANSDLLSQLIIDSSNKRKYFIK